VRQAWALVSGTVTETPERKRAQSSIAFTALLPAAMEVLERRRLAGTLLYGKCAPHEVEWSRRFLSDDRPGLPSDALKVSALLTGYELFLKAAYLALAWLYESEGLVPTAEQRPKVFSFVLSAVDLMCLPRPHKNDSLHGEATLLDRVRQALQLKPLSHSDREALQAAYDRLQASGIEAQREMELTSQENIADFVKILAKAQADNAARGLQSCAHCGAREAHVAHFKRCSACKAVVFCCKDCQLANWPTHKAACKAARKAAADAAGAV
jgi:hypothetical protein